MEWSGVEIVEYLLADEQRAFAERLGLLILAAFAVQYRQIVQRRRHLHIARVHEHLRVHEYEHWI